MSHQKLTMLSPKSMQIDFIPGGFAALTQSDICHALAGLDSLTTRIAYVFYIYTPSDLDEKIGCPRAKADQLILLIELTRYLQSKLRIAATKAQKLAICLMAAARTGQACLRCNGQTKYLNSSGKWQDCGRCDGTGHNRQTQAELARAAGVHHKTWADRYARDYAEAQAHWNSLLSHIHTHIKRRLVNLVAV